MMTCCKLNALAALAMIVMPFVSANMVLRQIHVVSRQGSPTTIFDGNTNNPIQSLSAAGEDQMEKLGAWIQDHYRGDTSWDDDGPLVTGTNGLVDKFLPTRIRIESTASETNTLSAQFFANGLFPSSRVPIFMQSNRNEITISAAEQCPTFANRIHLLYERESPDWMEMEASFRGLLEDLAAMPLLSGYATTGPDPRMTTEYIPLKNAWKVYDLVREAKVTCNKEYDTYDVATCLKLPMRNAARLLTEDQWNDLKTLVRFAEVETKYGSDKAVPFLAGNLLRQIADRMLSDELAQPDDLSTKRVFVTTADYPLMIALMKAIQVEKSASLEEDIYPGYGSAFVFELYQDDETIKHAVRVLYKAAENAAPTILNLGALCKSRTTCNMLHFASQVHTVALTTEDWCEACGNDTSDACMFYTKLTNQQEVKEGEEKDIMILENITGSSESSIMGKLGCSNKNERAVREGFLAAFVGGVASGLVLMCIFVLVRRYIKGEGTSGKAITPTARRRRMSKPETPPTTLCSSPLRRFWRSPSVSPPRNKDLDADCLSATEEDDNGIEFTDEAVSPRRRRRHPHSTIPSKQVFPPEII